MEKETIVEEAKFLRNRLKGSLLAGVPVDENDLDLMLLAAYYLGKAEASKAAEKDFWRALNLFTAV